MKNKAFIIGTLATVLLLSTALRSHAVGRVVHSAQNFRRYYRDLQQDGESLNPVERFVFSLVLANSKNSEQTSTGRILPAGRS